MPAPYLRSFAGGEITPEMYGRLDLAKYQTGLARCFNFRTLPHGPAERRSGTTFVQQSLIASGAGIKSSVRLLPFIFSSTQAWVLEIGTGYFRFHNSSGTLTEAAKNIVGMTTASPGVVQVPSHGFTTNDWVYVDALSEPGPTTLNGRFYAVTVIDADTFSLRGLPSQATLIGAPISTAALPGYAGGGTVRRVYTLSAPGMSGNVAFRYAQSFDVMTLAHPSYPTRELRRLSETNWSFTSVSFAVALAAPTGLTVAETIPTATNPTDAKYVVTSIGADLITESAPTAPVAGTNNLAIAGNFNTITWTDEGAAARYYVYKLKGGAYGYIGQAVTGAEGVIDDNIVPDPLTSPPSAGFTLNAGASSYPAAVTYFERRRWFGGTTGKPQTIWATRNGTESNLSSSLPSRADDALEFTLGSQQAHEIQHLVALQDIIALTASGEFRIFSESGGISIDTLAIKPQGAMGAADVQPALSGESALYVQAQGSRVREIGFDPTGLGRFTSEDVSVMAPHLFDGYTIKQVAYSRAPIPTLWVVRSDGQLLGLTHLPSQDVYGWHQHRPAEGSITTSTIESICVIPEDGEDVLYLAVRRRWANGASVVHVERMTSRIWTDQAEAFFVDAGLTYNGEPTTTIRGLWHLEGQTVQVVTDGAVHPTRVVTDGAISLDYEASVVHVGLGYTSELVTLPQAYEKTAGMGQHLLKNVKQVWLRVKASQNVWAGPDFDNLRQYQPREVSDPYGSPPALRTGMLDIRVDPDWQSDGVVCVRQDEPVPLTISAMVLDTGAGG